MFVLGNYFKQAQLTIEEDHDSRHPNCASGGYDTGSA